MSVSLGYAGHQVNDDRVVWEESGDRYGAHADDE